MSGVDPAERGRPRAGGVRDGEHRSLHLLLPSNRHQIVGLLREAIIRGDFKPGEQLRQDHLSDAFGVSPTPIREALRHLESEGLVVHFPNRGVFVAEVSLEEVLGVLLPVRLLLEQFAVASTPLTESSVAELEQLLDVMDAAADADDFHAASDADLRFHEVYVLHTNATHVINLWRAVHSRNRMYLHGLSRRLAARDIPHQHRELLAVLETGDTPAIDRALEEHIVTAAKDLLVDDPDEVTPRRSRTRRSRP
ncbi:MAG TPA: GntR family transcriptional regulator [Acidimicrobiales bacterium]|nr:GntR family transcriptional regulator [Acidimicrobiales bacterium]